MSLLCAWPCAVPEVPTVVVVVVVVLGLGFGDDDNDGAKQSLGMMMRSRCPLIIAGTDTSVGVVLKSLLGVAVMTVSVLLSLLPAMPPRCRRIGLAP